MRLAGLRGLAAIARRARTTDSRHDHPIAPNGLRRNFAATAPMESFFHTLKVERVHHRVYATRTDARRDVFAYIEGIYNSRRLHSAIGYRSPADMERMAA